MIGADFVLLVLARACPWAWVREVVNRGVLVMGFVVFFIHKAHGMPGVSPQG